MIPTGESMTTLDLCVICGAEWDDHTVRDMREHWGPAHPDLPFEGTDMHHRQIDTRGRHLA